MKMKLWIKKYQYRLMAGLFWIIVWQLTSELIDEEILFASPADVMKALLRLGRTKVFWSSIAWSCTMIALGFILAVITGVILAAAACRLRLLKEILTFLMQMIKSIPVASFVILILLWINSSQLSAMMAFLMVLPVIYLNVQRGIEAADRKLLEMAEVFQIPLSRRIRFIYFPALMPHFMTGLSVGLGFCWKSGIAAEVIGLPAKSVGSRLYEAKLYLLTPELFAWTAVIVILSAIFERVVKSLICRAARLIVPEMELNSKREHISAEN